MLKFLPSSITDAGTWWEIYPRTNQHHRRHGRGVQVYCRQLYLYLRVYLIQISSKNTIFLSKNPETVRSCTMYSRYRNIVVELSLSWDLWSLKLSSPGESLELPIKPQVWDILLSLKLKVWLVSILYTNWFYKLPVGQARSFDELWGYQLLSLYRHAITTVENNSGY